MAFFFRKNKVVFKRQDDVSFFILENSMLRVVPIFNDKSGCNEWLPRYITGTQRVDPVLQGPWQPDFMPVLDYLGETKNCPCCFYIPMRFNY